jgi:hypothetical protein
VKVVSFLELIAESGREQRGNGGLSRSGDAHDHHNHRFSDRVREGRGPTALGLTTTLAHVFAPDVTGQLTTTFMPNSRRSWGLSATALAVHLIAGIAHGDDRNTSVR